MEMEEIRRVVVNVPGKHSSKTEVLCKVDENASLEAKTIYEKLFTSVGLQKSSCSCFTLALWGEHGPERRLTHTDTITLPIQGQAFVVGELHLQKWMFSEKEERIIYSDPVALHLLFCEARERIQRGELKPSQQQSSQLEEFAEPGFCMEEAYVNLCHSLPAYFSVLFHQVTLLQDYDKVKSNACHVNTCFEEDVDGIWEPPVKLKKDTVLNLSIGLAGLSLQAESGSGGSGGGGSGGGGGGVGNYFVLWRDISGWRYTGTELEWRVVCKSGTSCTLVIGTSQLPFLLSALTHLLHTIQGQLGEEHAFHTEMVHKDKDGTSWENPLYLCSTLPQPPVPYGLDLAQG